MERFEHDGIGFAFERRGSGAPLLFLIGSGSSVASMRLLIDPFAARFDVAALDPRGMGQSDVPPGPWTMADLAGDALALADHLGWQRFDLFGVSFGGMVGQELAVTWPDRVDRLVLACTSAGGEGGSSYPLQDLAALDDDELRRVGNLLLDTRFTPAWLAAHPQDAALAELMGERRQGEGLGAAEAAGAAEQLRTRATHDVWDRLPAITCPTLVAAGRFDGIAPEANSRRIAGRVPGAELRTYEGGHAFFVQDASALPEMLDFLDGRPAHAGT